MDGLSNGWISTINDTITCMYEKVYAKFKTVHISYIIESIMVEVYPLMQ